MPRPRINRQHEGVRKITRLMIPAIFGSSVAQINLLLDTLIASFLVSGSITWLYYSDRLLEFPLGVLGIAIATVILPALSRHHAQADGVEFNRTLNWAMRLVILIALPAGVGLFILSAPIIATLFEYGRFTATDTYNSSLSLMAYIIGLPAFIMIKILAPGYYARQDTRTPVRIGIIAMVSNMVFNVALVVPMVMLDFFAPHIGLAMATTISAYVNAFLLYTGLRQRGIFEPEGGWGAYLFRIAIACTGMGAIIIALLPEATAWQGWSLLARSRELAVIIVAGGTTYFMLLWMQGLRVLHMLKQH